MEQIRQKAQSIRDTKLIDKVSITSSNCDEQDLADFNDNNDEVQDKHMSDDMQEEEDDERKVIFNNCVITQPD